MHGHSIHKVLQPRNPALTLFRQRGPTLIRFQLEAIVLLTTHKHVLM
jgi:hypothetical protein